MTHLCEKGNGKEEKTGRGQKYFHMAFIRVFKTDLILICVMCRTL